MKEFNRDELLEVDKHILERLDWLAKEIIELKKAVNLFLKFHGHKTFDISVKDKNHWSPNGY